MQRLFCLISNLNREAQRYEQLARERFSQAKISPALEGQLLDQGVEYKLAADALRLEAAKKRLEADRMLKDVPPVVLN